MPIQRKYGCRFGLPGDNRFPRLAVDPAYPPLSPDKSLLETGFMPPVFDQITTSGCTGHGYAGVLMYARAKQGLPFIDLSRLFPYWNARSMEGTSSSDSGAVIADVITASQQYGDCPYIDLPTEQSLVTVAPPPQAFTDAILHKTLAATRVWGKDAYGLQYHAKHVIDVLGLPVLYGVTVYASFESQQIADTGIVPMPGPNEKLAGGHCIWIYSYDDATRKVRCRNSWSKSWGQQGDFEADYDYIFNPAYSSDFHAVTLGA
jgi:C1A family cysteine protease